MLTNAQRNIIKATVPLLETGGEALTKHFYTIMLNEYTDVRPLFNKTNQLTGDQPRALAHSILMYAKHIDNLQQLGDLVAIITNKHAALQVLPEQYAIVGSCILRAIGEVLGAEVATYEVIEAWRVAYGQLADVLIKVEEELYQQQEDVTGGWRGERLFRVAKKVPESSEIVSFYLEPKDGKAIIAHKAGQYLGLRFVLLEGEQRRNYSISEAANGKYYRISVKREPQGVISNHLHDNVKEGDIIRVYPPFGEFTLQDSDKPLLLISGGVGITPILSMLQTALTSQRPIYFIHAARNAEVDGFRNWIKQQQKTHSNLHCFYCYEQDPHQLADAEGMIDHTLLAKWLPADKDCDAYLLGPKPFMATIKKALKELGVPETQTHFEFFGPASELA
ncbi:NO-inducible flavohemoprotein [Entomomonas asaccharolytica]|uniref:Flavohemoprotein n=1 Tax=Entomomonas asaccharolytica TaxID=2785331 RepID=A0A974NEB4_9GAMM|nr:NO-inducible flavohemoprotein [Entomomonas asaccharolytica]QQP84953.1 NO-inducible flavohemoprotein [Entomomonas asaccharolytica]